MSLQTYRVAPGQVETVGSDRETHDDLGSRGTDRKSEVIYPVPLSIRIIHTMWVAGTIGVIMMLLFG
tara:strand:- start:126 stop:326 length:201 start_codon:yes stop_codon:yes gene_type:complete